MSLPRRLIETIDTLYHVFDSYAPLNCKKPRERYVDVDQDLPEAWLTTSPRILDPRELGYFYSHAMTTFGNEDFFRWILPRAFELTIASEDSEFYPELFGSKLTYGEWLNWPARQRDTIRSSISLVWESFIQGDLNNRTIDEWLGLLESSKLPLAPFLAQWDSVFASSGTSQRRFLDLIESIVPSLPKGKLDCFWDDQQYQFELFKSWFLDARKLEILESSTTVTEYSQRSNDACGILLGVYREMVLMSSDS